MSALVDMAREYAEAAHFQQVRPYTGDAYIAHPARVSGYLTYFLPAATAELTAAAWLHDVVEDTPATIAEIKTIFGGTVALLVEELTKPNEPISQSAMAIKACDLIDNIGSIAEVAPKDKAIDYLAEKAPQVLRICEGLRFTCPALAERLAQSFFRNWDAVKDVKTA